MSDPTGKRAVRWVQTATHWGMYELGVADGQVIDVRPWAHDSHSSHIGRSLPGALCAPGRIRGPMVRKSYLERGPRRDDALRGAEAFVAVDWDTAIGLAAQALRDAIAEGGNEAIYGGSYGWASAGRFHHAQSQIHRFLNCIGGYTSSVNTYSTAALEVIIPHVLGLNMGELFGGMPTWEEIAQHTRLVVAFGGMAPKNQQVNPGGVGDHSATRGQQACRDAGVRFVNIGPLRDDVLDLLGAEWLQVRPSSDLALMLALAYVLISEDLYDREFIRRCCVGFGEFHSYLTGLKDGCAKSPEWAAALCAVPAARIRDLAREIAAGRTLITASWSLQRAEHGEQLPWMASVLAALSGSMGLPGGGFGTGYGAVHSIGSQARMFPIAALPQGKNAVESFIPVARIADMLLEPGGRVDYNGRSLRYPDIHVVYWAGGNPFHHHQDLNKLVRAWQRPSSVIVHDSWWNSLARHADIVFPVSTASERNDFAVGAADRHLAAMYKAVEPPTGVLSDYEVFERLAEHLGVSASFTENRTEMQWIEHLYAQTRIFLAKEGVTLPEFDVFWREGRFVLPAGKPKPPICAGLRQDPERNPLSTPSGRLEIHSEKIASFAYDDCPPQPTWLEPREWLGGSLARRFPLHLISNQPRTRLHSQLDNGVVSLSSKIAGREPLVIHPQDAAARGIATGDIVRTFNDRGACLAGAIVSDSVMCGVVTIATGAWYDPETPGQIGSLCVHGNPNVLTADRGTSKLAQGPSAHSTLVEIERYDPRPLPPVNIFDPPTILAR